jgi:hypothetical protein
MTAEGLVSANHFAAAEAAEGDWVVIPAVARPQPAAHRTYLAARRGAVRPAPHAASHPSTRPATVAKPAAKKPVIVAHASTR